MRIHSTPDRMVLRDTPGITWAFGLIFAAAGALVAGAVLLGADGFAEQPLWARLMGLLMGLAHLSVGVWLLRASPAVETVLDRASGVARVSTILVVERAEEFPLAEVAHVDVVEKKDSEGEPLFSLRLRLHGGRAVAISSPPSSLYRRDFARRDAEAVRRFLGLPEGGAWGADAAPPGSRA